MNIRLIFRKIFAHDQNMHIYLLVCAEYSLSYSSIKYPNIIFFISNSADLLYDIEYLFCISLNIVSLYIRGSTILIICI